VGDRYRVSENNNTVLLNLHNVTRDDAGHYTLTAKNSAGEARRAIEIKVDGAGSDAPVFLRRLTDLAVKVGTRTRFLVEIRSSTEVTVSATNTLRYRTVEGTGVDNSGPHQPPVDTARCQSAGGWGGGGGGRVC